MVRPYLALLGAMCCWGASVPASHYALHQLAPVDLLLLETSSGTAVLTLIMLTRRRTHPRLTRRPAPWRLAFTLGALEPALAYLLANMGLVRTSSAVGSILLGTESLFFLFFAWLLLRQRVRRPEWIAIALGFIGVIVVTTSGPDGQSDTLGIVYVLGSAMTAAGYGLVSFARSKNVDSLRLVHRQGVSAIALVLPVALTLWIRNGSSYSSADVLHLTWGIIAGVWGFAIPFVVWTWAVQRVRAGAAAISLNLVPLSGVFFAAVAGLGAPSWVQLVGGGVVLIGLAIVGFSPHTSAAAPDSMREADVKSPSISVSS